MWAAAGFPPRKHPFVSSLRKKQTEAQVLTVNTLTPKPAPIADMTNGNQPETGELSTGNDNSEPAYNPADDEPRALVAAHFYSVCAFRDSRKLTSKRSVLVVSLPFYCYPKKSRVLRVCAKRLGAVLLPFRPDIQPALSLSTGHVSFSLWLSSLHLSCFIKFP